MTFEEICAAAEQGNTALLEQHKNTFGHLDVYSTATCDFTHADGTPFQLQIRFTPASFLASTGNKEASDRLDNPTGSAIGFILAGRFDLLEEYRLRGASVHRIAWALALVGQHDLVDFYAQHHNASFSKIIDGYEMCDNQEKMAAYTKLKNAANNKKFNSSAHPEQKPESHVTFEQIFHAASDAAENPTAPSNDFKRWKEYGADLSIKRLGVIQIHKADGTECDLQFRHAAETLLAASGQNTAAALIAEIVGHATDSAIGFALMGKHAEVERCRTTQKASVNKIAEAYAMVGYHDQVRTYLTEHHASLNSVISGYTIGNDSARAQHYQLLVREQAKRKEPVAPVASRPLPASHSVMSQIKKISEDRDGLKAEVEQLKAQLAATQVQATQPSAVKEEGTKKRRRKSPDASANIGPFFPTGAEEAAPQPQPAIDPTNVSTTTPGSHVPSTNSFSNS